jgi:glycosyltransferase involved in cell wall biosynthesis
MNLNFNAPINNSTGYGITSTNILLALSSKNIDLRLFNIGSISVDTPEVETVVKALLNKADTDWNKNDPCLKIWHQHDLATRIGRGKYGALIFFEVDQLLPREKTMINNLDVVFVASKWAKVVLEKNDITIPIVVSPLAVDTEIFRDHEHGNVFKKEAYRFINIGKWELRKGHDFLLEAFNKAFEKEDNVELVMINHNPFLSAQENQIWTDMYKTSKLGDKITILPRVTTQVDLAKVIRDTDCGIFPARAEGWNNEILEVMALNKPVITTDYSAHTEYCTPENSFLIDIDDLTEADDGKFFKGTGKWADLGGNQINQTVEYLRKVYKDNIKTNPNGLNTVKKYTWNNTASILSKEMLGANPKTRKK